MRGVVVDRALPLLVIVAASVLVSLLLSGTLHVLSLEIVLQLPELGLNLVLAVLADHLDCAESLFSLAQLVLFLLLLTAIAGEVETLIDTTAVTLADPPLLYLTPSATTRSPAHHRKN